MVSGAAEHQAPTSRTRRSSTSRFATMALAASASVALFQANGDGAETTRRGHQLLMTSIVLTRCIRLLPGCASKLKSRLRHEAQVPDKSRYRTSANLYGY